MTTADAGGAGALDVVVWASGALAVGSALLAVSHLGVQVPLLSALGPGGSRVILPAAIAFTVGAALHGAVAFGVARRRAWAWPLGILVAGVTLLGAATPFRGAGSAIGILLASLVLGLLLTATARHSMIGPARS
ncbi:hypothetical protein BH23ACT10_BH23ACT10_00440 [soil metagenome]